MPLTAKQSRFASEYVNCSNGTKAAIAAGYSAKTARAIASENLKKHNVLAEISKQQRLRETRLNAAQERTIHELLKIVEVNLSLLFDENGTFLPMGKWPSEAWSIVASYKYGPMHGKNGVIRGSIKLIDRIKLLELLMETTGLISRRRYTKRQRRSSTR